MSKTNMVTAIIREEITTGVLPPSTKLRQRQLAERLNVSVTPVREALRRLESEGLVEYDPHFGACVIEVDFGPTAENFLIRAALESLASGLAASQLSDDDLDVLDSVASDMQTLSGSALSEANRAFHQTIYEGAQSPVLNSFIRRLWQSFDGGPLLVRSHRESDDQHREIIDALRSRDPARAAQATRAHILTGMARTGLDASGTQRAVLESSAAIWQAMQFDPAR